jgi:hypothetical protein
MNDAVATKDISIHDQIFSVSAPYAEGMTISAVEAKVLNQTRAENIANNFRKKVKAALEGTPLKEGDEPLTMDTVAREMAEYDAAYNFSMPSAGREPVDPVEREAIKIAKQAIRDALSAAGKKVKDIPEDKFDAAVELAAQREDIVKEAQRRVKAQKKSAETALAELGL